MGPGARIPFIVHCVGCGHDWPGAYLPLAAPVLAHMLRRLHCPNCGHGAEHIKVQLLPSGGLEQPAREAKVVPFKAVTDDRA